MKHSIPRTNARGYDRRRVRRFVIARKHSFINTYALGSL